ncbi:MAG: hypothetical protein DRJ65_19520, partial [Acidobacteria bacterium]
MKKLIALLLLLAFPVLGQPVDRHPHVTEFVGLPFPSDVPGELFVINDSLDGTCPFIGGGTQTAICLSGSPDGINWTWISSDGGAGGSASRIEDADGDTSVDTEASADADTVVVTTGGSVAATFNLGLSVTPDGTNEAL